MIKKNKIKIRTNTDTMVAPKFQSLTVVILTYNEEIHIERCIHSVRPIAEKVFVVDSYSTDRTVELANALGAEVVQRKWKNYADQFQWGLDNCGNETEWIMRMDADEFLEPELQKEILNTLPAISIDIHGLLIKRKHFFMGKWIRYGGRYPLFLLRIWRSGKGKIEQRWMDEHIVLQYESKTMMLKNNIVDENLKGITFFVEKHNSYATREAIDIMNQKLNFMKQDNSLQKTATSQAKNKRILKDRLYANLPMGVRAIIYFLYRFLFLFGFIDGPKGWLYHFLQGLWYRLLVDIKAKELEIKCEGDVNKLKRHLLNEYGINC